MPRAVGKDLCEIFGYAPDDISEPARKQWKSQSCPFIGGTCIKHTHPQRGGEVVVLGTCSIANKTKSGVEEVIICAQRLYANDYEALKLVVRDATKVELPIYMADRYSALKKSKELPENYVVLLGHNSGKEIQLSKRGVIQLSLDWVMARVERDELTAIIPCEVQSADITGNYQANWDAYRRELREIPDSEHGMNWANIWKRIIPQLILKGSIAATSRLCKYGHYFVVPDRVFVQFEKLLGQVNSVDAPGEKVLNVLTYGLGPEVPHGSIRSLQHHRTSRMLTTEFAKAFASGKQLPLGSQLDDKVVQLLNAL